MTHIRHKLDQTYNLYKTNAKMQRFVHMDEVLGILEVLQEALEQDEKAENTAPDEFKNMMREGDVSFTGLYDVNMVPVCNGCIIKIPEDDPSIGDLEPYAVVRYGKHSNGHIGFYADWDGGWILRQDLAYWIEDMRCTVVGSIYDNPEPLEGEDVQKRDDE